VEVENLTGGTKTDQLRPQLTLRETLEDKELNLEEERVVKALDVLSIPFADKTILFGAHIFFESGVFKAKDLLGFSFDRTVAARDKVRMNKRYEDLWKELEILTEPNFLEVATLKRKRIHHREIARELEIEKTKVDEISKTLITHGIIKPSGRGRSQAGKFEILCRRAELIEDPLLSDKAMAEMLGVSDSKIERARARLRNEGRARARTHSEVRRSGNSHNPELRRQVIELYPKYTAKRISEITGVPYKKVKNQITILKRSGDLPNSPLEN